LAGKRQNAGLLVEADWSRGVIKDLPRTAMPQGVVYDSVDYLLHRQGVAEKRGGTSYFGPPVQASVPVLIDSSTSAHDIITHGNAHVDTGTKKFGDGSAGFGNGDFLSLDASTDFVFGTGNFTVDFQVYLTSAPASNAYLFDCRPSGASVNADNKLDEDTDTGSSIITNASLHPEPNRLYLLSVAVPGNTVTSVTGGGGLDWVKVTDKTQSGIYCAVYRAMKPSGLSSGQITVTFSGAVSSKVYVFVMSSTVCLRRGLTGRGRSSSRSRTERRGRT